jgi:acetylornithine deacetylase
MQTVVDLLCEMIAIDSQSSVSNVPLANFMQSQLEHWEIERIDYVDREGIAKTNIVAADPESTSPLAFAGHLDTVSATGWDTDPFRPTIAQDRLTGLGATDMKGPIAAFLSAAKQMDPRLRPKIVLTADEEVTKQGVREVVAKSRLLRDKTPKCFIVCEPTCLDVVRGHRVDVQFVIHSRGRQAHSSTGQGLNANLQLVPFLSDIRDLYLRLRRDVALHDTQYDPPFCDLNFVIDNYGAFPNMTVGLASNSGTRSRSTRVRSSRKSNVPRPLTGLRSRCGRKRRRPSSQPMRLWCAPWKKPSAARLASWDRDRSLRVQPHGAVVDTRSRQYRRCSQARGEHQHQGAPGSRWHL